MTERIPYAVPFDLTTLTGQAAELLLEADAVSRAAIAEWLGAVSLDSLTASVRLRRLGEDRVLYEASYSASFVQSCVVTLEPVPSLLAADIVREYRVGPGLRGRKFMAPQSVTIDGPGEEDPEMLEGTVLDLAAPVLEDIALNLDPYPRAAGAVFAPDAEGADAPPSRADNPFAILAGLRSGKPHEG